MFKIITSLTILLGIGILSLTHSLVLAEDANPSPTANPTASPLPVVSASPTPTLAPAPGATSPSCLSLYGGGCPVLTSTNNISLSQSQSQSQSQTAQGGSTGPITITAANPPVIVRGFQGQVLGTKTSSTTTVTELPKTGLSTLVVVFSGLFLAVGWWLKRFAANYGFEVSKEYNPSSAADIWYLRRFLKTGNSILKGGEEK